MTFSATRLPRYHRDNLTDVNITFAALQLKTNCEAVSVDICTFFSVSVSDASSRMSVSAPDWVMSWLACSAEKLAQSVLLNPMLSVEAKPEIEAWPSTAPKSKESLAPSTVSDEAPLK